VVQTPVAVEKSVSPTEFSSIHSDIHAHNTFEQKDVVVPQTKELKTGGSLVLTFPPASVTAVNAELA
jgi:alpha-L-arabinofuranosidase